ncbi:tyrosine-type recombinase/integrase [Breznakia pachnodae]|uniref:Integrase/recombinase XerD n=1 Tax=Breznakia pachnodae TaxID=265178 RepID=A0ABU0E4I4_9FIRM|nr:tyrosine-type recombinase/integrase [Breznakia pachnodae]MDQ0361639.1 integrase/recombinase XerD [Breznakia pachnodae]
MRLDYSTIDNYINYCENQRKLGKQTIKAYKIDMNQFHCFCKNFDYIVDKTTLQRYMEHLNKAYKSKSVKRKIATIKAFFNYLEFEEKIELNPMRKIRVSIKEPITLPKTIQHNDLDNLYKLLYSWKKEINEEKEYNNILRDICILELLISTGIRVSEISDLKPSDINLSEKNILISGKGNKERIVQIGSKELYDILSEYMLDTQVQSNPYLFMNKRKSRISDQSIRMLISKYAKLAGITERITPHMFRHTFATYLLEEDVDIRYIQKILGHSSITTTQIYTHIASSKQRYILENKNPRSRIHT